MEISQLLLDKQLTKTLPIFQAEIDRKTGKRYGYSALPDFRTHRLRINWTAVSVQFLSQL